MPAQLEGFDALENVERYHVDLHEIADPEELKLLYIQFKRDETELWNHRLRPAKERLAQLSRKKAQLDNAR